MTVRQTFKPVPASAAPASGATREGAEKLSDGVWLYSYIAWIRLSKMLERNSAMIENGKQQVFKTAATDAEKADGAAARKATKSADLIRMYDLLLQVGSSLLC